MSDAAESIRDHVRRTAPEGVVSVYLFGSEAAGESHAESDVDVGVLFDRRRYPDEAERTRARNAIASELIAGMEVGAGELGGSGSPDEPDEHAD